MVVGWAKVRVSSRAGSGSPTDRTLMTALKTRIATTATTAAVAPRPSTKNMAMRPQPLLGFSRAVTRPA